MQDYNLDFHSTFRQLSFLTSNNTDQVIEAILAVTPKVGGGMNHDKAHGDLKNWLNTYSSRIQDESSEWESEISRQTAMKGVNPRFILRQWVLEDVITKVESDPQAGKRVLAKVLQVRYHYLL